MIAPDAPATPIDRLHAQPPGISGCTSLDPHESSVELPESPVYSFRHSGWSRLRTAVWHALKEATSSPARLARYAHCGSNAWVCHAEQDPGRLKLVADYCRDRFCRPCATAKAHRLVQDLEPFLAGRTLRFVTLTLRSSDTPLADQLKRLNKCFRRLRQRKLWQTKVAGGIAVTELTHSPKRNQWHPHLHVLVEGRYISQHDLASNWASVTGDSHIVDIRKVAESGSAIRYLCKYFAKGVPGSVITNPDLATEAVIALTGQRLFTTFGDWHGLKLTKRTAPEVWVPIDTLSSLIRSAESGGQIARDLLNRLILTTSETTSRRNHVKPRGP